MSASVTDPVAPLQFEEPVTITSVPGRIRAAHYQRFRVTPDVWVTVHEDGRVAVRSNNHDMKVVYAINSREHSLVEVETSPKQA